MIYDNVLDPQTGAYRDVLQNLRLPGFSSIKETKVGDYVRLKEYKSVAMSQNSPPQLRQKKQPSSKSSSDNWSIAIYNIFSLKKI